MKNKGVSKVGRPARLYFVPSLGRHVDFQEAQAGYRDALRARKTRSDAPTQAVVAR